MAESSLSDGAVCCQERKRARKKEMQTLAENPWKVLLTLLLRRLIPAISPYVSAMRSPVP
eukprot:2589495-Rhodomonas_salina.1